MKPEGHAAVLVGAIAVLAALFAMVEIQIEGGAGWGAGLPTWTVREHWLLDVFWGGRPMTGYHAWVFPFMAAAFHLPFALLATWSWRLELRALGCLMWFWIVEDALWFAFNPAFGLGALDPGHAWWHPRWLFGMPVDYTVFGVLGAVLIAASFRPAGTGAVDRV